MTVTIRLIAFLYIFLMLFSSCDQKDEEVLSDRPNILFIMSDDHTSQAWGIYDGLLDPVIDNPNIKRLAKEGAKLTQVFCTNSICVPSRASILTGQYSHVNGVYTLADSLPRKVRHVAHEISNQGYQTALIGKWHLKTEPQGFDYYNVLPGQGVYFDPVLRDHSNWPEGKRYSGFSTEVITRLSLDWLDQRDPERPFLLMTHFKATHEPFDYPDSYLQQHADQELPYPSSLHAGYGGQEERTFSGQVLEILGERYRTDSRDSSKPDRYPDLPFDFDDELPDTTKRKLIYQKFIKDFLRSGAVIDDQLGVILDYLDEHDLTQNTVVIYTADQGYFLGEHGIFDKRIMYEEALRMPFVIRYPPEIRPGSVVDDMILNIDFASLFMDYAGINSPPSFQGQSFRENLQGNTPRDWRKQMYYRYWLHEDKRPAHLGIRTENQKLIYFYGEPLEMTGAMNVPTPAQWEFYDLQSDPNENLNLIEGLSYQERIAELKQELFQLQSQWGDTVANHIIYGK